MRLRNSDYFTVAAPALHGMERGHFSLTSLQRFPQLALHQKRIE
jgi:hypothetical protein